MKSNYRNCSAGLWKELCRVGVWQPAISESICDCAELFRTVWQQQMRLGGHFLFHSVSTNKSEMRGRGDPVGKGSIVLPWHIQYLPHLMKSFIKFIPFFMLASIALLGLLCHADEFLLHYKSWLWGFSDQSAKFRNNAPSKLKLMLRSVPEDNAQCWLTISKRVVSTPPVFVEHCSFSCSHNYACCHRKECEGAPQRCAMPINKAAKGHSWGHTYSPKGDSASDSRTHNGMVCACAAGHTKALLIHH